MQKNLRTPIICTIVILTLCVVAFAAYTSRSFVKGVATTPNQGVALSSDYLMVVSKNSTEDKYPVRKIIIDEKGIDDSTSYTFTFFIQNSAEGLLSEKSMRYTLYASGLPENVAVFRGEENITNQVKSNTGALSPIMPAYTQSIHYYSISIPKETIANISDITFRAVPDEDSDSSGNILAAKMRFSVTGLVAGFSYNGTFLDRTQANKPYEFAAFNYEISVSNASQEHEMVLIWDKRYVEPDSHFLREMNLTSTTNGNLESVVITMDAYRDSYLVQFYRLSGQNQNETWQKTWEDLEKIIIFKEKD